MAIAAILTSGARDGILAQGQAPAPPATATPAVPAPANPAPPAAAAAALPPNAHVGRVMFLEQGVPGATVTATQGDKKMLTSTDGDGVYRFVDMAPGAWTIKVE